MPDTGGRLDGIEVFSWTPREFIDDDLLQFCFTDANDAKNQIPFIRERVQTQLKRFAVNVAGRPGAVVLRDPSQTPGGRWGAQEVSAGPGEPIVEDLPVARRPRSTCSSSRRTAASPIRPGPGA